jgi:hypothetical protein
VHDNGCVSHKGVARIFAKALDKLLAKIRQDFYERCVVGRRAKIQPQMIPALDSLHVSTCSTPDGRGT